MRFEPSQPAPEDEPRASLHPWGADRHEGVFPAGWGKSSLRPSIPSGRESLPHLDPHDEAARTAGDTSPRQELVERIYGSHRSSIRSFFRRALRSEQDAEDLTQDTFLRAHGSARLDDLRNPGAFLFRIARNLLRDRFRHERLVSYSSVEEIEEAGRSGPTPPERTSSSRASASFSPRSSSSSGRGRRQRRSPRTPLSSTPRASSSRSARRSPPTARRSATGS